jgi:hypothetical protein
MPSWPPLLSALGALSLPWPKCVSFHFPRPEDHLSLHCHHRILPVRFSGERDHKRYIQSKRNTAQPEIVRKWSLSVEKQYWVRLHPSTTCYERFATVAELIYLFERAELTVVAGDAAGIFES